MLERKEKVLLVTVSDDRFGRKGGVYEATQNKIHKIFKNNPSFGITDFLMMKWPDIEGSKFFQDNQELLKHTDAGKNGRAYKPYAILKGLESIENGDYLIYTDCSPEMWQIPTSYKIDQDTFDISILKNLCKGNNDILTAFVKWKNTNLEKKELGIHTHRWFTTNSCLETMGLKFYEDGYMHASGMWVIRKTEETFLFILDWLKWNLIDRCASLGPASLGDDSFWTNEKESGKLGHRHDQSISGLLLNKANHKLIDIVYNEMNPYNFLQFARKNQKYTFHESLPIIKVGDSVENKQGTKMIVWRIDESEGLKNYIVGQLEQSCYSALRQDLKLI